MNGFDRILEKSFLKSKHKEDFVVHELFAMSKNFISECKQNF